MNAGTFMSLHLRLLNEGVPKTAVVHEAIRRGWINRNPFGQVIDARTGHHYSVTPEGETAAQEVLA